MGRQIVSQKKNKLYHQSNIVMGRVVGLWAPDAYEIPHLCKILQFCHAKPVNLSNVKCKQNNNRK